MNRRRFLGLLAGVPVAAAVAVVAKALPEVAAVPDRRVLVRDLQRRWNEAMEGAANRWRFPVLRSDEGPQTLMYYSDAFVRRPPRNARIVNFTPRAVSWRPS